MFLANDRIILKWQTHAGRFDEKTIDAYLSTLRFCEEVTGGKSFVAFSTSDAAKVREAEALLKLMPSKSLINRRSRAIFSIALLGALRPDTVISLQIKHVDVVGRRIIQDGAGVRAKYGARERTDHRNALCEVFR